MNMHLYPKLALEGMRKNKRLYIPYIFMGSIMVMMFYIVAALIESPALLEMSGGSIIQTVLPLGLGVIGIFSLLFLFYTNAFILRQRGHEFGLYNVLGMDKRHISRIILWESLMVACIAIGAGLLLGIALFKFAEAAVLDLLHVEVSYAFHIGTAALLKTAAVFGGIYLLLSLRALFKVLASKPLELLHASRVGEKPAKANWAVAVLGLVLLGFAYFLAIKVKEPLSALLWFFVAVILVVIATYLLFIAGSVTLCRLLQKNKTYYYRPNHFVSVSSMAYRMKRNGAGLASICILATMVLVMLSSTASLYIGAEDTLKERYPYAINMRVVLDAYEDLNDEQIAVLRQATEKAVDLPQDAVEYRLGEISGLLTGSGLDPNMDQTLYSYDAVGTAQVISLADFNRVTGQTKTLADDECLLYGVRYEHKAQTFSLAGGKPYAVKEVLREAFDQGNAIVSMVPTVLVVVRDFDAFIEPVLPLTTSNGHPMMQFTWNCGFNTNADAQTDIAMAHKIIDALHPHLDVIETYSVESLAGGREGFYEMYGSLLFLGIMLSIVFIFAAVLIIYYKQIAEGYEDAANFEIMQNVGMTKREIRKSINSQVLTVFFAPLLFAGLHLGFAFPLIWRLLQLFAMHNMPLLIGATVACFLIFGLFYALVYRATAHAYYNIVSGAKDRNTL